MRKFGFLFLFPFFISLVIGCRSHETRNTLVILKPGNEIDGLIAKVSNDSLETRIRSLQNFSARHTHEQQMKVADYIYNFLKQQNLEVEFQAYLWKGQTYKNIEAVIRGNKNHDQYFVIGAHYDSKSEIPDKLAPGADDNGSGVAALLELARIVKKYELANTIRIVFFSNEEQGLHGSASYVRYLKGLSGQYLGAIIVDTIGYNNGNCKLNIATIPRYQWLALTAHEILDKDKLATVDVKIDKYCT